MDPEYPAILPPTKQSEPEQKNKQISPVEEKASKLIADFLDLKAISDEELRTCLDELEKLRKKKKSVKLNHQVNLETIIDYLAKQNSGHTTPPESEPNSPALDDFLKWTDLEKQRIYLELNLEIPSQDKEKLKKEQSEKSAKLCEMLKRRERIIGRKIPSRTNRMKKLRWELLKLNFSINGHSISKSTPNIDSERPKKSKNGKKSEKNAATILQSLSNSTNAPLAQGKPLGEFEERVEEFQDQIQDIFDRFFNLEVLEIEEIREFSEELERMPGWMKLAKNEHLKKIHKYLTTNGEKPNIFPVPENIPNSLDYFLRYTQHESYLWSIEIRSQEPRDEAAVKHERDIALAKLCEILKRKDAIYGALRNERSDLEMALRETINKSRLLLADKAKLSTAPNAPQKHPSIVTNPAARSTLRMFEKNVTNSPNNSELKFVSDNPQHILSMQNYLTENEYQFHSQEKDLIVKIKSADAGELLNTVWQNIQAVNLWSPPKKRPINQL